MYFALLTSFFVLLTPILVWIEWRRQQLNERFRQIPGPKQLPIIGSIYSVRPNKLTEMVEVFDQIMVAPTVKLIFGGKLLLFVTDPEHLAQIFPTRIWLERSYIFDMFELKSGMLAAKLRQGKEPINWTSSSSDT
uniref:CSON006110 protein n=1 Tax=Culicoides sonorensis TaxID=179676 RepID=A0A336KL29_CULSO